jgi:hypothetical protein
MRQTKRHSEFFRSLRHGMEQLEDRRLLADTPPTGDLTEGNASAWEAFADGSTASLSNNSTMVRQGSQSLRFVTQGGFDAGVRLRAPAANWNMSQIDVLAFWIYGENNNQFGWQGDQPVIKLLSAGGSITLTPSQQAMPNHAWAYLSIPLSGSSSWQRSEQGTFDIGNVTALEVHHDTWDFGFVNYYDGLQLARYQDLPGLNQPQGIAIDSQARTIVVETASNHLRDDWNCWFV